MKVLTVFQPWASLIAFGVKTIETRPWPAPAALIGQRIGIHAGSSLDGILALPGDCDGRFEDGWHYGYVGDWQASVCVRTGDTGRRGDGELASDDGVVVPLAFGVLVATARLAACLPVVACRLDAEHILAEPDELWLAEPAQAAWHGYAAEIIQTAHRMDGQLPYGDFTPGRWGWILDDIEPVVPPRPMKGQPGLWTIPEDGA